MSSKHLTLTDRCMIEKYLLFGYSFREIATKLNRQPSTISREIKHINDDIRLVNNKL